MRILIIQTAFLGDVILTTPLIRRVSEFFPLSEIFFLTTPQGATILQNHPLLREIIIYDKHKTESSLLALYKKARYLKSRKIDIAFLPHRSFRSALLAFLSGIPERVGFRGAIGSVMLTKTVERDLSKHEVERNLSLLSPFTDKIKPAYPEVYPSREDYEFVRRELKEVFADRFGWRVIFAPGSEWATKRYPRIYYAEVGRILLEAGVRYIILIGGKEDRRICEDIQKRIGKRAINVAGLFTPLQSCALMTMCSLLISNDSAPLHMASAVRLPAVGIFGPTTPKFGFGPYGRLVKVVETELDCRPCNPHGPRVCPLRHHMCMRNISPYDVADAAFELLAKRFWLLRTNPELFIFPPK
jgi:heptosyltransferase-2